MGSTDIIINHLESGTRNFVFYIIMYEYVQYLSVAAPGGNCGNVPPPNPENLKRMGNSPRLSQQ